LITNIRWQMRRRKKAELQAELVFHVAEKAEGGKAVDMLARPERPLTHGRAG
jgi:hypothetical protein